MYLYLTTLERLSKLTFPLLRVLMASKQDRHFLHLQYLYYLLTAAHQLLKLNPFKLFFFLDRFIIFISEFCLFFALLKICAQSHLKTRRTFPFFFLLRHQLFLTINHNSLILHRFTRVQIMLA